MSASNARIEGAVPVLVAPFHDDGSVDNDSLRRQIDFCLEAGAQAVAFGWGTESHMLTDAERVQMWSVASRHIDGRVPLIAATSHASREGMIALTRMALDAGADCAMVNPDRFRGDQLVALFRELSERVALSLMIQDAHGNAPADALLRAVDESPRVVSLKLESSGAAHKVGLVVGGLRDMPERGVTVVGGSNGERLLEELERGSVGTLPHPAIIDAFRDVCDRYATGDAEAAEAAYGRVIQPLSRITAAGSGSSIWLHKTIFHRAGVLSSPYCRVAAAPLPDWAMEKVWEHLARSDPLISRWRMG